MPPRACDWMHPPGVVASCEPTARTTTRTQVDTECIYLQELPRRRRPRGGEVRATQDCYYIYVPGKSLGRLGRQGGDLGRPACPPISLPFPAETCGSPRGHVMHVGRRADSMVLQASGAPLCLFRGLASSSTCATNMRPPSSCVSVSLHDTCHLRSAREGGYTMQMVAVFVLTTRIFCRCCCCCCCSRGGSP